MRSITLIVYSLFVLGLIFLPVSVSAQLANKVTDEDIILKITPEIPGAFERVTVTLDSYITDLDRAYISWQKDGKQDLIGYGKKQLSFTTGNIGESITITANIQVTSGEAIVRRVVVNPAEIGLLWEGANTYVPPFYRGRALPTSESAVRIVAIPQIRQGGKLLAADNYVFTWKRNGTVIQNASGFGKNEFVFQQDYLNPQETVEVIGQSNVTGSVAQSKLAVKTFSPQILFYEKNPLTGIRFQEAIRSGFTITGGEKTLIAIPYFISPKNIFSSELKYEWKINGLTVQTPDTKNVITVRSGAKKGVASVDLLITSLSKLFLETRSVVQLMLE